MNWQDVRLGQKVYARGRLRLGDGVDGICGTVVGMRLFGFPSSSPESSEPVITIFVNDVGKLDVIAGILTLEELKASAPAR
jgi:hypothetical protein